MDRDWSSIPESRIGGQAPADHAQQDDGDGVADAQCVCASWMKTNGRATGKVTRNTQRNTPTAPFRSVQVDQCPGTDPSHGDDACAQGFALGPGCEDVHDHVAGMASERVVRVISVRHGPQALHQLPTTSVCGHDAHDIEACVDDPHARLQPSAPISISRTSCSPRTQHAQRAGEGQHHDQAEEGFHGSLHGIERTAVLPSSLLHFISGTKYSRLAMIRYTSSN